MTKMIGQLSMRVEDGYWMAYFVEGDSRLELGRVLMAAVEEPEKRQEFLDFMTNFLSSSIEEVTGEAPEWKHDADQQ